MPDPSPAATDASIPASAKASRARKPKRKASEITIASVDSHEGSAVVASVDATPVKKPRATKTMKEKMVKEKKGKAVKNDAEKDEGGTGDSEMPTKRQKVKTERAAIGDNDDSVIEATPMEIGLPIQRDDTASVADYEDEEFEDILQDPTIADPEDSNLEATPVQKGKVEPKTKATKAKVDKAPAKVKAKVEKVTKVKAEKVEKPKTTKDIGVKGGAKDKKEKVEQVTGDAATKLLKDYLTEQNRPYNGTDISTNLHGKIKKTLADKLLQELATQGQIMGKASGKSWVYWCIQDPKDAASPEELAVLDTTISQLCENIPTLKATAKNLSTQLNALKATPTTSELRHTIRQYQALLAAKKAKLSSFREGRVKKIEKEEMDRVEREWAFWGKKRVARKKAFEAIEYELMAGMSREDIWEKYERDLACKRALRLMVSRAGIEGEDE